MNQEEFYYLYINVNCLADLGLRELEHPQDNVVVDINHYMDRAYSYQDILQKQADQAFERANLDELDHSLELIPQPLPCIQKRMNGEDMKQWQNSFARCDDPVMSLVAEVRLLSVA